MYYVSGCLPTSDKQLAAELANQTDGIVDRCSFEFSIICKLCNFDVCLLAAALQCIWAPCTLLQYTLC